MPPLVLVENVPGFLTSNRGHDLHEALIGLNRLGYSVDIFTLDAVHFVPQSRNRLFSDRSTARTAETVSDPLLLQRFIDRHPIFSGPFAGCLIRPNAVCACSTSSTRTPSGGMRIAALICCPKWSACIASPRKRPSENGAGLMERYSAGCDKAALWPNCALDGIAGCLRTPRGGSARQILFKGGYGRYQFRLFSPRECARLMGADDFHIEARRIRLCLVSATLFAFP